MRRGGNEFLFALSWSMVASLMRSSRDQGSSKFGFNLFCYAGIFSLSPGVILNTGETGGTFPRAKPALRSEYGSTSVNNVNTVIDTDAGCW